MKYFIRSVKYFFYFAFLTTLIIFALTLTGMAEGDIETMFKGGYNAIWKMALFFVVVAAVYPKLGFIKRSISYKGEWQDIREEVINYFKDKNFELESESREVVTFRHRGLMNRLTRMFEDRVTLTFTPDGIDIDGLRKDVFRISTGLEYRLNPQE